MSELKPCPFCGSEPIEVPQTNFGCYSVACVACEVAPEALMDDKASATAAWNRRATPTEGLEEILNEIDWEEGLYVMAGAVRNKSTDRSEWSAFNAFYKDLVDLHTRLRRLTEPEGGE